MEDLAHKLHTDIRTVRAKLEELGLAALGETSAPAGPQTDETLEPYLEGMARMYEQKWSEAAALFERVLAETDHRHIADRTRQNLTICRDRLAAGNQAESPYLQAIYDKNRGAVESALEICLAQDGKDESWNYLRASLEALSGQSEAALEHLESAIRLEPKNRIHAYHDPDFAAIRDQEAFRNLIFDSEHGS